MSDGPPPLHADLEHLVFLLGSWKGKGTGDYPDIDPFEYLEVSTFTHVGKPFIAYAQRTRDLATGEPLHAETGYLRPVDAGRAEFVIAQPTGIVEIHDVEIRGTTLAHGIVDGFGYAERQAHNWSRPPCFSGARRDAVHAGNGSDGTRDATSPRGHPLQVLSRDNLLPA